MTPVPSAVCSACPGLLLQAAGLAIGRWALLQQATWAPHAMQATGGAVASVGALLRVAGSV